VTLPVFWIPDANEDLREAQAWYDNIRPGLGERFALAVETTVEAIAEYPLQFPVVALPASGLKIARRGGEVSQLIHYYTYRHKCV
jgi:hypothetical protein